MNWRNVRDEGGLFFISLSGGKDSDAMYIHLRHDLCIPEEQIILVHAHLGVIEWDGILEHIKGIVSEPLNVVQAVDSKGQPKDFMSMVKDRGMWPAPKYRQCTSDLKRGPIYKFIRKVMKERGSLLAVNCTGMRSEESTARKKKVGWELNKQLSKAGREVYEWLPIKDWLVDEVYDRIYSQGMEPFHAYGYRGDKNERLSCVFCIMGSVNDHVNGARHRPELYEEVVNMERMMGHTMFVGKGLEARNGLTVAQAYETQITSH